MIFIETPTLPKNEMFILDWPPGELVVIVDLYASTSAFALNQTTSESDSTVVVNIIADGWNSAVSLNYENYNIIDTADSIMVARRSLSRL